MAKLALHDSRRLREAQNLQWSEDLYELAIHFEEQSTHALDTVERVKMQNSAVEHYTASTDFDKFNEPAWRRKAKLLYKMRDFLGCQEAVKACIANQSPRRLIDEDDELYQLLIDA